MGKQSHEKMILAYMREHGSITAMDAVRDFGCMRLAARISDLRWDGHDIETVYEAGKNRNGETVRYARYYLHE